MDPEDFKQLGIGNRDIITFVYEEKKRKGEFTVRSGVFTDRGASDKQGHRFFKYSSGYTYDAETEEIKFLTTGSSPIDYETVRFAMKLIEGNELGLEAIEQDFSPETFGKS